MLSGGHRHFKVRLKRREIGSILLKIIFYRLKKEEKTKRLFFLTPAST